MRYVGFRRLSRLQQRKTIPEYDLKHTLDHWKNSGDSQNSLRMILTIYAYLGRFAPDQPKAIIHYPFSSRVLPSQKLSRALKFKAFDPLVHVAPGGGPPPLLFYARRMLKFKLQVVILLPVLLFLLLSINRNSPGKKHGAVAPESEVAALKPCAELHVTKAGVLCESRFGIVARLDFPEVDLKSTVAGGEYLPQAKTVFMADTKIVGGEAYRNIAFVLRWEPATPEFLQIYLDEYLPYWGNQVPYRLFWNMSYEVCVPKNCTDWVTVNEVGEFLPSDINDLSSNLAADINFNGVPAAFWNTKITQ